MRDSISRPQKTVDGCVRRFIVIAGKPMSRPPALTPAPATVSVLVPGPLRDCCSGAARLALCAADLRGLLAELERGHPALHRSVCDETGAVRRHVNLFVNTDHIRDRDGLDTALAPGDEVIIMPAVSGG
jgi:molybdopterin converting factor small subunit